MPGWKFVFQLPAVGEVGVDILFRLHVLISVFRPLRTRDRLVATGQSQSFLTKAKLGHSIPFWEHTTTEPATKAATVPQTVLVKRGGAVKEMSKESRMLRNVTQGS
jgi:hypothetical protein